MMWDDEAVAKLTKMWGEGFSASQIAGAIGGASRNAVLGKVYRLRLLSRGSQPRRSKPRRMPKARSPRIGKSSNNRITAVDPGTIPAVGQPKIEDGEVVVPRHKRKSIVDLETNDCRWPIGDPQHEDFHFCHHQKLTGLPYCEFHTKRAFQPEQPRRSQNWGHKRAEVNPAHQPREKVDA